MPQQFSISIDQVVDLLGLERDPKYRKGSASYNVKCPFCGDTKYHMNINTEKNTYNCVHCADGKSGGGVLDLYGRAALGISLVPGKKNAGGNGNYLYSCLAERLGIESNRLNDYKYNNTKREKAKKERIVRASDDKLHKAYTALLGFKHFALNETHRNNLIRRGLDDDSIIRNEYRSINADFDWVSEYPDAVKQFRKLKLNEERRKYTQIDRMSEYQCIAGMIVADEIQKAGINLKGVPGFFKLNDKWLFRMETGMLIPTRNHKGQIVGFQARKDHGKLRYMTVSSKGLPEGVEEGIARTHFPLCNKPLGPDTMVMLTEGPLKADIAGYLANDNVYFIAIQGVNNRTELPAIFDMLKAAGVTTIWNALDMDKLTNPHVAVAGKQIRVLAKEHGLKMSVWLWDKEYTSMKYMELLVLCRYRGLSIPRLSSDMFVNTGILADFLTQNGIKHSMSLSDSEEVKNYWRDETKGIDDFLLYQRRCKEEAELEALAEAAAEYFPSEENAGDLEETTEAETLEESSSFWDYFYNFS